MIPTIETIVEDLAAGRITKSQAVTWLHQHAESAVRNLRDDFAAMAINLFSMRDADLENLSLGRTPDHKGVAKFCYALADAMLAEREKAQP